MRTKLFLKKVWRWVRWPLLVLVLLYIALAAYRIPQLNEKEKIA